MSYTREQIQAQLGAWLEASSATARNASYTIDGRTLTRSNADEIQRMIRFWQEQERRLNRSARRRLGGSTVMVPRC